MARYGTRYYPVSRAESGAFPERIFRSEAVRVVFIVHDSRVSDPLHDLVNDWKRHEKPLARLHGISEAVLDFQVKPDAPKKTVQQVFELRPVDIAELVRRNDLHVREKECRVQLSVRNPGFDIAAGDADLVDHVSCAAICGWLRLAPQNIDRAAFVPSVIRRVEERSGVGVGDAPAQPRPCRARWNERSRTSLSVPLSKMTRSRAFLRPVVSCPEFLADLSDIGFLAAEDEKLALLNFGLRLKLDAVLAHARFEILLHLSEKRLEAVEILAGRTVGDFLGDRRAV